ncbi:MAG: hypothetical protein H3C48_08025 [Chitinophagaceae bacterium]|nr:hypothetical protein [Chitinophagaceae bacterium]
MIHLMEVFRIYDVPWKIKRSIRLVNGADPEDVIYGILKVKELKPNGSVDFDYRIGKINAHLAVVK